MKKITVMATLICVVSAFLAFRQSVPAYKNLKVLPKKTTKQEMDSIMRHFSMSLGVRCNFCHVRNNDEKKTFNFASDDNKHKLIARSMYKMMVKINKKYFEESESEKESVNRIPEVSCYSCHHGKEHPENRPPAPAAAPGQNHPAAPRTGLP